MTYQGDQQERKRYKNGLTQYVTPNITYVQQRSSLFIIRARRVSRIGQETLPLEEATKRFKAIGTSHVYHHHRATGHRASGLVWEAITMTVEETCHKPEPMDLLSMGQRNTMPG